MSNIVITILAGIVMIVFGTRAINSMPKDPHKECYRMGGQLVDDYNNTRPAKCAITDMEIGGQKTGRLYEWLDGKWRWGKDARKHQSLLP